MKLRNRALCLFISLVLAFSLAIPAFAVDSAKLQTNVNKTAEYMLKVVSNPQVGSIGGEWAVLGLARSGYNVPEKYYQDYYSTVEKYVKACGGVLHEKKYTEYSRLIVALSSIGKDPTNVAGYNLLTALGDYDKTIWQGLNGPIWALIALDSGSYAMPQNPKAKTQATRQMYIDRILACQLPDGGWSLFGGTASASAGDGVSDPDITGMALQALAKYQDQPAVSKASGEALDCVSKMQNADGGFASWGTSNSESCVQIIVALCELGISLDDARFVKNGSTTLDNLLTFRLADGSFRHTADGSGNNQMSSEQGFYAIAAALRAETGKSSLYRMSDSISVGKSDGADTKKGEGLAGKNADVQSVPITAPGVTFDDIYNSENRAAIESLAARGIINGKGNDLFDPEASMTRAEFAAIVTRGLGLAPQETNVFSDVAPGEWYAGYIGCANKYGIVNGVDEGLFDPEGTITRQEAATMAARAAKLCGMDTEYSASAARDVLAQFGDYVKSADWARASLAFCYDKDILSDDAMDIEPEKAILRCEIAQMLFNMLSASNLL